MRHRRVVEDGEVGAATDGSERVCQGGGAMQAALGPGEKRGFRRGEPWSLDAVVDRSQGAQTWVRRLLHLL